MSRQANPAWARPRPRRAARSRSQKVPPSGRVAPQETEDGRHESWSRHSPVVLPEEVGPGVGADGLGDAALVGPYFQPALAEVPGTTDQGVRPSKGQVAKRPGKGDDSSTS